MSFSRVHADSATQYSASATSVSVTIHSSVAAGDLIAIGYMVRSTVSVPSGFTKYAEIAAAAVGQRNGWLLKISDGTEGGSSVTVAQASSARIEAFHCIHRHSSGSLEVSQTDTVDGGSLPTTAMPSITESGEFLAIALASNVYCDSGSASMVIYASGTDAEFAQLNTATPLTTNANRLYGVDGIYTGADTADLTWQCTVSAKDWQASMVTIIPGAGGGVTGSVNLTESGNTASSAAALALSGALSKTQAADTASIAGAIDLSGALSVSQEGDSVTSAAALAILGVTAETQEGDSVSSATALTVVGSLSATQAGDTLTAEGVGVEVTTGALSVTQDANTASSAVALAIDSAASVTQDSNTASAVGEITITAGLSQSQAGNTVSGAGSLYLVGTVDLTNSANTITSAGSDLTAVTLSPDRIFTISAEDRVYIAAAESRVLVA